MTEAEFNQLSRDDLEKLKFVLDSNGNVAIRALITSVVGSVYWGEINGVLSNQTDLINALNAKKNDFSENTAFNKNFGTSSGEVLEGNSVFDASRITTGVFDIARLPAGAVSILVVVSDQTARFSLTTSQVQNGDTVKQSDNGFLYYVKDDTNLGNASGYEVYNASIDWSLITNKPVNITEIAGLTKVNDNIIQIKGGVHTSRTMAQLKTDLSLASTDSPTFAKIGVGIAPTAFIHIKDDSSIAPLNITERSSEPTSPNQNDLYMDDGTNTASSNPGWRRYTGSAWEDVGSTAGGGGGGGGGISWGSSISGTSGAGLTANISSGASTGTAGLKIEALSSQSNPTNFIKFASTFNAGHGSTLIDMNYVPYNGGRGIKFTAVGISSNNTYSPSHGIHFDKVSQNSQEGIGLYIGDVASIPTAVGTGIKMNGITSNSGKFFNLISNNSNIQGRTLPFSEYLVDRGWIYSGSNTIEDFDILKIHRRSTNNHSAGTYNGAGSVLNLINENVITNGAINDNVSCLELTQANNSKGGHIRFNATSGSPTDNGVMWFDGTNMKIMIGGIEKTFTLT